MVLWATEKHAMVQPLTWVLWESLSQTTAASPICHPGTLRSHECWPPASPPECGGWCQTARNRCWFYHRGEFSCPQLSGHWPKYLRKQFSHSLQHMIEWDKINIVFNTGLGLTWLWVSNQCENGSWIVVDVKAQSVVSVWQLYHEMRISIHCKWYQSTMTVMNMISFI